MFAKISAFFAKLFPKGKFGVILGIIVGKATTTIAAEILDPENQKKAYEFVKELNKNKDMTNAEKAKVFNKKMLQYAKKLGKKLSISVVNCLRELAVNAVKVEAEGK